MDGGGPVEAGNANPSMEVEPEVAELAKLNKADKYLQTKKEREEYKEKIKSYSRN